MLAVANMEDAGWDLHFAGTQGRWLKTPTGSWVEMARRGKRYFLDFEYDVADQHKPEQEGVDQDGPPEAVFAVKAGAGLPDMPEGVRAETWK